MFYIESDLCLLSLIGGAVNPLQAKLIYKPLTLAIVNDIRSNTCTTYLVYSAGL